MSSLYSDSVNTMRPSFTWQSFLQAMDIVPRLSCTNVRLNVSWKWNCVFWRWSQLLKTECSIDFFNLRVGHAMPTSINDLNELYVIRQWLDGMWHKYALGGLDSSTSHSENHVLSKRINKALHSFGTKFWRLHVSSQQRRKGCPHIIGDLISIFSKVCWLWRSRYGILGWKNGLSEF